MSSTEPTSHLEPTSYVEPTHHVESVPDEAIRTAARSAARAEKRDEIREAARRANESRTVRWLARAGLASNGLVHIIIGLIAIGVALGTSWRADQAGALTAVASTPGGVVLLWIAAISLFGLAFWQLTDAAWVTAPRKRTLLMRRLTDLAKAIGFAGVGLVTLVFALGARSPSRSAAQSLSSMLLDRPGGTLVLAGVGAVVGGVGIAHLFRGVSLRFREENQPLTGARRIIVSTLGLIGHLAKGIAFLIIAGLAIVAAFFTDAKQFTGLDGALRYLSTLPYGVVLLIAVAVGFIAYGLYLIARARFLRR